MPLRPSAGRSSPVPGSWMRISGFFCIWLALMLLILPLKWLVAAVVAAFIHEACHALAVKLCGGEVKFLSAYSNGAVMSAIGLTGGKALICALAGPLGGLSLLFLVRWFPRTAICAACQSLYNLLPVEPLDGGNALRLLTEALFPGYSRRICTAVSSLVLLCICLLALYGCLVLHIGFTPLLFAGAMVWRWKKHLAKHTQTGYNDLNEHKGA